MRMDNMVCPNCGAQNSQYGECEYCGTIIKEPKAKTVTKQNDAESFAKKIAKYQKVEPFIGGVAVVSIGKQHGAINEQGDIVIPLSSSYVYNYDGRLLVSGENDKVMDVHGNILVQANRIIYIGNGEYLIRSAEGCEAIFNQKNEHLAVKLPEGIRIYLVDGSLGYGCYLVSDSTNNTGIALKDRLLLPCHYHIYHRERGGFYTANKHLVVIEDKDIIETNHRRGLYNLETRTITLPCQYAFSVDSNPIGGGGYDDGLLVVYADKNKGGVFDVRLKEFVLPLTKCARIVTMGKRCYKIIKNGFFGSKEITIQL